MTGDSTVPIESASPPYVECIHWLPRRLASGAAAGTTADVVFDQRALQEMRVHAAAAPDVSVAGVLIGRVFRDPTCSRSWVLVEATERVAAPLSDDPSMAELQRSLSHLPVPDGQVAVGWYRTHPRAGLYLSEAEAEYHRTNFPAAWQCAVVLLGEDERTTGGVFQRTERGLSRSAYAPYYERIDPSSELGGRTCRTFSGWTNYETQASVALAGQDGVSSDLPPLAGQRPPAAPPTTEPPAPEAADLPGTPGAPLQPVATSAGEAATERRSGPSGAAAGAKDLPVAERSEDAWSKLQIQRSLTAVGRTLTPSALGELGAPAPVVDPAKLEADEADGNEADPGVGEEGDRDDGAAVPAEPGPAGRASDRDAIAALPQAVLPAPPDSDARFDGEIAPVPPQPAARTPDARAEHTAPAGDREEVLVGRSRRRSRHLPRKVVVAAAGLIVMAAGIWVGIQVAGTAPGAIDQDPDGTDLAPARIGVGDQPLFGERPGAVAAVTDPDALDRAPETAEDPTRDPVSRNEGGTGAGDGGPGPGLAGGPTPELADGPTPELADGGSSVVSGGAEAPAEATGDDVPSPTSPRSDAAGARAPDPFPLVIDDPVVAAYEDALQIFRKESDRYEDARRDFDDGLRGCNPLNLALRGVRGSFERLSERFEEVRDLFAGPGLRAFESAERQAAVIQRHYELTDCPPPIGG